MIIIAVYYVYKLPYPLSRPFHSTLLLAPTPVNHCIIDSFSTSFSLVKITPSTPLGYVRSDQPDIPNTPSTLYFDAVSTLEALSPPVCALDPASVDTGESSVPVNVDIVGTALGNVPQSLPSNTKSPGPFDKPPPAQPAGGEAMLSPDRSAEEDWTPVSQDTGADDDFTPVELRATTGSTSPCRGHTMSSKDLEYLTDSTLQNLNRVQKNKVYKHDKRPCSPSVSSRGKCPSNLRKGKGPDPNKWGLDMSDS
ncbi:hypothetical protein NMY22_g11646 [Coprinellus aureogranulatus]|nr:hypothetical protein NMY22_g11646 [Coprinellus aureogranulatus]